MQVRVEDVNTVKKILHIEIPEEEVTRELDEAYKNINKTAKIKGFRPGRVPRAVLERLYKKNVSAEITSKLIQESFAEALKETDLKYVGNPAIDPPEPKAKEPYRYDATIELHPEIKDIDIKGIKLKKQIYKVTEDQVEAQLAEIQKTMTRLKPLDGERPVQDGDVVLIDFEGFKDGQPFDETRKTENFGMKVGAGQLLKEFDETVIGMTPGETREFSTHFPEDHPSEKLANTDITFQVTLKEIRQEDVPEINDELAARLGKQTVEELKDQIRENLTQGYDKRTEQEMTEQIFSAVLEQQDFEVPDIMVEYELNSIISEAERSFTYQNTSMEELGLTREILSEKYRDTAVSQVKRSLILNKLIEQENVSLSDEELENEMKEMSQALNKTLAELKNHYRQNQEELEYFKHMLLEKKVIRLIVENSELEVAEPE